MLKLLLLTLSPALPLFTAKTPPASEDTTAAEKGPPALVYVTTKDGAQVSPGKVNIVLEFDRPMDARSMSWVPLDDVAFPPHEQAPHWVHGRVCSFVAELEPGVEYGFGLNTGGQTGFVDLDGTPLPAIEIRFTAATEALGPENLAVQEAAAAVLMQYMRDDYAFRAQRDVDWAAWEQETRQALAATRDVAPFIEVAKQQLAQLQDLHIRVGRQDKLQPTYVPKASLNRHPTRLLAQLEAPTTHSRDVMTARSGELGYLYVGALFNGDEGEDEKGNPKPDLEREALEAALKALKGSAGVVVDLRAAMGGDMALAELIGSHFVSEPVTWGMLLPTGGEASPLVLEPARPTIDGPVAVLQSGRNMDESERLLMMLRQAPVTRSFGETSFGSIAEPELLDLSNNVHVALPTRATLTPEMGVVEGVGLVPDEPVAWTQSGPDPVLAAALEWLKSQG